MGAFFITTGRSCSGDIALNFDALKTQNNTRKINLIVKERIEQYKLVPPTRLEAFKNGSEFENSIGESHFEIFMTSAPDSPVVKIFQKLNGEDKNHAARIESYMKKNGLA